MYMYIHVCVYIYIYIYTHKLITMGPLTGGPEKSLGLALSLSLSLSLSLGLPPLPSPRKNHRVSKSMHVNTSYMIHYQCRSR